MPSLGGQMKGISSLGFSQRNAKPTEEKPRLTTYQAPRTTSVDYRPPPPSSNRTTSAANTAQNSGSWSTAGTTKATPAPKSTTKTETVPYAPVEGTIGDYYGYKPLGGAYRPPTRAMPTDPAQRAYLEWFRKMVSRAVYGGGSY